MERLFELIVDNKELLGIIHLPDSYADSKIQYPCIIICYGFNGNRRETNRIAVKFARQLTSQGIACVRFDYIGCGVSAGEFHHSLMEDRVNHVLSVVDFVSELPFINKHFINFVGFSDGCRIVLDFANSISMTDKIRSIALWSPVLADERETSNLNLKKNENKAELKRNKVDGRFYYSYLGLWVHPNYFKSLNNTYLKEMNKVIETIPTLCVLAENDERNPVTRQEIVEKMSASPLLKIQYIKQANHLYESKEWIEELLTCTSLFFQQLNQGATNDKTNTYSV